MIRTSVIPGLSSGLAKYNKIMSTFVLFSRLFSNFESLAFFENRETNLTPKQSNTIFLGNISKVQQLNDNFLQSAAILTKALIKK